MRLASLLLLACAACGPKPGPQPVTPEESDPPAELGRLVGSWISESDTWVEHLDIDANGHVAIAEYQGGELHCVRSGSVTLFSSGDLLWNLAACGPGSADVTVGHLVWFETADTLEFESEHQRYRRVDGPLVTEEVMEQAIAIRDAPPESGLYWAPDQSDDEPTPDDEPVMHIDASMLRTVADTFAKVTLQDSYFCASYGRSEHSSARWSAVPHVTTSTRYQLVILVPKEGGDASGSLEMDGDSLAMDRVESDDGLYWVLWQYATIGDDVGALTVDFEDDQDVPSMLLACSAVE